jgi:hypothetical protein
MISSLRMFGKGSIRPVVAELIPNRALMIRTKPFLFCFIGQLLNLLADLGIGTQLAQRANGSDHDSIRVTAADPLDAHVHLLAASLHIDDDALDDLPQDLFAIGIYGGWSGPERGNIRRQATNGLRAKGSRSPCFLASRGALGGPPLSEWSPALHTLALDRPSHARLFALRCQCATVPGSSRPTDLGRACSVCAVSCRPRAISQAGRERKA